MQQHPAKTATQVNSPMWPRKIAVLSGYSYGPEFDRTEFKNKIIVKENEQLIKLVQTGRVDSGVGNSRVIAYDDLLMGIQREFNKEGRTV